MRIHQLDEVVANQIAAGEVVERPASVVKELLENSIDAGADNIEISIEEGGIKRITIVDNGSGISKQDLRLAIMRHATSKIRTAEDLVGVHTLGFRGEALASIVSVSNFSLSSRTKEQDSGWKIVSSVKAKIELAPAAQEIGTKIEVSDLFCTTPVRRKFLRSERTEFLYVEDIVKRIILSNFDCAFTFKHNKKIVFKLPACIDERDKQNRIAKLLGNSFMSAACEIEQHATNLKLSGWVSSPDFVRRQSDLQYFFINNRAIKDKVITHAIRTAYLPFIDEGNFPAFVLYLQVEPKAIDVNVHPTKQEVRFSEARMVHDFITSGIEKVLAKYSLKQQGGLEQINSASVVEVSSADRNINNNTSVLSTSLSPSAKTAFPPASLSASSTPSLFSRSKAKELDATNKIYAAGTGTVARANDVATLGDGLVKSSLGIENIVILFNQYVLCSGGKEGFLFDLSKLNHFIIKKILSDAATLGIERKPLLFPYTFPVHENEIAGLAEHGHLLHALGFFLKVKHDKQLILQEAPICFMLADLKSLIKEVIKFFAAEQEKSLPLLIALVLKYAPKEFFANLPFNVQQKYIEILLEDKTLQQRKVYTYLSADKLEKLF